MRVLVDTNIVIDVALERQPFLTDSLKVLTLSYRNDIEAFVSASTISDIYYIIRKLKGREATLEFLTVMTTLCQVATVNQTVILGALNLEIKDFEDAIQYETAVCNQLDAIVTRNPQDFLNDQLAILTPEQLIERIGSKF